MTKANRLSGLVEKFHQAQCSMLDWIPLYPGDIVRVKDISGARVRRHQSQSGVAWSRSTKTGHLIHRGVVGLVISCTLTGRSTILSAKTGELLWLEPDEVDILITAKDTPSIEKRQEDYLNLSFQI